MTDEKERNEMSLQNAVAAGKSDPYCHAVGGFCVAAMPGGTYDYFPAGMPPHIIDDSSIKKAGHIVERYVYTIRGWRHILVEEA